MSPTSSPSPIDSDDLPGDPLGALRGLVAFLERAEAEINAGPIRPSKQQRGAILAHAHQAIDLCESALIRLKTRIREGWRPESG